MGFSCGVSVLGSGAFENEMRADRRGGGGCASRGEVT